MANPFAIERFLNIRAALSPSFSPDGRFVAFLTNTTGVSQLWLVPIEGGWPVQLTFTNESVRGAHFNPRRHELIYSMDIGGNERTQLFHLHGLAGGTDHGLGEGWTSDDLTQKPKAIHSFGGWCRDGTQFAFSANRDDPGRFDLYVQRLEAGSEQSPAVARLVQKGPGGYYQPEGWSPDDRFLLVRRAESNFNQDLYVVDVARGEPRHLTQDSGDVQYHGPRWSADGKRIFCATTAGGRDLNGLAAIDVDTGRLAFLDTPQHEVEEIEVSSNGRWLAWLVNVGGKSELRLRDLKTTQTRSAPGLPLGVVSHLGFAPDGSRLAFTFEGPRHNPDVWVWDLAPVKSEGKPAAQVRQLTHASRAGLPFSGPLGFVEPELVHYKSFDGRQIPAWWYEAPAAKAADSALHPVIVYPHGGPESQSRPAFSPLFQYFLKTGYSILAPNVRGSSGYGTAYMNLDNTTKRMDSVADLAHAAYWLRDKGKGDPKRLAVYGGSYGGFMVLAQVTHYPDLWAAGIDAVGICNFITFMEKTGPYRRAHREAEYGNLREHRAFLEKISPINHVDRIKCPMLVIHGANDPRVPIAEAEQIVAALKRRGVPVEYLRYNDEGHGLTKLKNRLDAYPRMVAFLDKHLK